MQFVQDQLQVARIDACDGDVAARHGGCDSPCGCHDAIPNHPMFGGVQLGNSGDGQGGSARALDLRAHLIEHLAQVDHIGFASGVVDSGHTFGDDRCHEDVLGRSDRGELQLYLRPAQMLGGSNDATVLDGTFRPELTQTRLVHIERPRPDRVAAGQRDAGALASPDKRAEHAYRCAELADSGEVGLVFRLVGRRDPHHRAVEFDVGAQSPKHLRHQRHVEDVGAIGDGCGALGQEAGRHKLEHAVLGPADGDLTR